MRVYPRAYPLRVTAAIGQRLHSAATLTQKFKDSKLHPDELRALFGSNAQMAVVSEGRS